MRPAEPASPDDRILHSRPPEIEAMAPQGGHSVPLDTTGVAAPLRAQAAEPWIGRDLGGYRILEFIGAGGFSMVFRARHAGTGVVVALKLPRMAEFVSHLRREASVMRQIQDPDIPGILESHLDHDPPFLVMPFVAGPNLALPSEPPAPEAQVEAFRALRELATVVARLHDAGIAHGDLKPGNIRLDADGRWRLLDLGLARCQVAARQLSTLRASILSVTGERIAGTLEFMAPELMAGKEPGAASDVYALGVILHHLLCGRPPAFGVSPTQLNPFLPAGTVELLRDMLRQDSSKRIPCGGDLLPPLDRLIRAEERCLKRRNGHARRRVFESRMRTLARGVWLLLCASAAAALIAWCLIALPALRAEPFAYVPPEALWLLLGLPLYLLGWLAIVLGMTTINAWVAGVPEREYKQRRGHPWWNFMMQ